MASVDLVFPPLTGVNYPYLSTPSLLAYIRANSSHVARQHDLNLEVVRHLLRPATVAAHVETARAILRGLRGRTLDSRESLLYARAADLALRGDTLVAALPAALAALRSPAAFDDPTEIGLADQIVADALDAASVAHPPQRFNLTEPIWLHSASSPAELRSAVEDPDTPLARLYDAVLDPARLDADVLGLSIVYHGQVLPGLVLAAWLKRRRPDLRVLVGGPFFTVHRERLADQAWLFDWISAIAVFEGETTLLRYLDTVDGTRALEDVPGLVWHDGEKVRGTGMPEPVDVDALPCPDFDGLDLDGYHMPARTLPLLASRGCYWRCAFCTHHYIYGDSYRVRSKELLESDLAALRERWRCEHVYFVDESMSPRLLRHISAALPQDGRVRWGCELRAERSITREDLSAVARSGCRVLSFGVESANQRVLESMGKGILVADVERIVRECGEFGIRSHLMAIVAFPGETVEESDDTFDFIRRNAAHIDLAGFSYFCLLRHSPVDHAPGKYFVDEVSDLADTLRFEERRAYRSSRGLTMAESFDRWSGISATPDLAPLLHPHGHGERERFLFAGDGPGTNALRTLLGRLPIEISSCEYDLVEARGRADRFLAAAGRAYNLIGTTLRESWLGLTLPPLVPLQDPDARLFAFSPTTWQAYSLHPQAAYLLVNVHRWGREHVLAGFDAEERPIAQHHIGALASAGLLPAAVRP
jgi:anaerobic magnesium-protoporphyrin IX monomethyl ester cyclase